MDTNVTINSSGYLTANTIVQDTNSGPLGINALTGSHEATVITRYGQSGDVLEQYWNARSV
jgi:hypothetical protein